MDRVSDDIGFVGKIRYDNQATGAWTSFAITTGKDFSNAAGVTTDGFTNRTRYSWLIGLPLSPPGANGQGLFIRLPFLP